MTVVWLIIIAALGAYILTGKNTKMYYPLFYALIPPLLLSLIPVEPLLQVVLYLVLALLGFLLWRIPVKKEVFRENPADKLIKQPGIVTVDINGKYSGKVKVLQNIWKAKDINEKGIKKGEYVIVEKVQRDTLIVKRAAKK